jgi:cell division protein FtsQ
MKKLVIYIMAILVLAGCFIAYSVLTKNQRYKEVVFEIAYPSDTLFTVADLEVFVKKNCPEVVGQLIDSVSLLDFAKELKKYPFLDTADIVTNQGVVTVKARQEKVIAKVFGKSGNRFYLAKSGKLLPDSSLPAGRVVVANGNIADRYKPNIFANAEEKKMDSLKNLKGAYSTLYTVWKIADYLDKNEFWKAQIGQIYVDDSGDINLITTVGEQCVIFGKILYCEKPSQEVKQRFDNLKSVYKQGFKITGWDKYKTINLKFGQEVPCEKRVE